MSKICVVPPSNQKHPAVNTMSEILEASVRSEKVFLLSYSAFVARMPTIIKIFGYLIDELNISMKLLRALPDTRIVILFQKYNILPAFLTRLCHRKLMIFVGGSTILDGSHTDNPSLSKKLVYDYNSFLVGFCNGMADVIVVMTPSMIKAANLGKYQRKVRYAQIFPSLSRELSFDTTKQYDQREKVVGFVGSLEKVKGIVTFVKAVQLLCSRPIANLKIVIIGDGALGEFVKVSLEKYEALGVVKILGWLSHASLPVYYNDFKLLVMPSLSEGVPSALLEAMSCGTPVLATPVGGIPDIISDGETGFLLKSSEPGFVADRVMELLEKPSLLRKVSEDAYVYAKRNFSKEKTIKAWQRILTE
jgi:glycosyltransferase involved in cell wall biosynthesis